ncbi:MAG: enoyl-CoA hydratase/isomerase family protein [Desulfobacterales bacterium]|nr:enoyl-CoA hydratase/isomerase family protein [Desulfobacterales bacterium]
MAYRTLELEIERGIAVLYLNRPDRRNAMSDEMAAEFASALDAVAGSDAGALVVTGRGSAFCAGGDLQGFRKWADLPPAKVEAGLREFYGGFLRILHLSIPTVAAVNGPAVGAGACLAAACDLRLASEAASIGFTFVKLGINPGMGAEYLLHRLVGPGRAVELLLTGEVLPAAEAHRMGLFTRVVPAKALMEEAAAAARRLGRLPSFICRVVRRNIAAAAFDPVDRILEREARNQAPIFTDPAFQAKVKKMIEELGTGEDA